MSFVVLGSSSVGGVPGSQPSNYHCFNNSILDLQQNFSTLANPFTSSLSNSPHNPFPLTSQCFPLTSQPFPLTSQPFPLTSQSFLLTSHFSLSPHPPSHSPRPPLPFKILQIPFASFPLSIHLTPLRLISTPSHSPNALATNLSPFIFISPS